MILAKQACAGLQALAPGAHLHWSGMPRCRCRLLSSAEASSPREGLRSAEASPLHHACVSNLEHQESIRPLLTNETL